MITCMVVSGQGEQKELCLLSLGSDRVFTLNTMQERENYQSHVTVLPEKQE